jgi:biopolymer transport protein ExbB
MLAQWKRRANHKSWASRHIRQEMISRANAQMRATLPLLKVLVPLCPLLGLLGTVTGMLEVFDAMAARGYADARTMAYGVSHAMISTMAGLVVSMSGIFFVGRFATRTRVQTELLADALAY